MRSVYLWVGVILWMSISQAPRAQESVKVHECLIYPSASNPPPLFTVPALQRGVTTTQQYWREVEGVVDWQNDTRSDYVLHEPGRGEQRSARWRSFDEVWEYDDSSTQYLLDAQGRILSTGPSPGSARTTSRSFYTYRDDGRVVMWYTERMSGDQWRPASRQTYAYDDSGRLALKRIERDEHGEWYLERALGFTYDDRGLLSACTVTPGWFGRTSDHWLIGRDDLGRMVRVTRSSSRNGSPMVEAERFDFTFDKPGVISRETFVQDGTGAWVLMERADHQYGAAGRLVTTVVRRPGDSGDPNSPLRELRRALSDYDSEGRLATYTLQYVDPELGMLVNRVRRTYAYAVGSVDTEGGPATSPLSLSAAPNPTRGPVTVRLGTALEARVEVFDTLGRRLLSTDVRLGDGVELDLSSLGPGRYIVRAITEVGVASQPVTVAR